MNGIGTSPEKALRPRAPCTSLVLVVYVAMLLWYPAVRLWEVRRLRIAFDMIWLPLVLALSSAPSEPPCLAGETAVVVLTANHDLVLCERGRVLERYKVALGTGGTGKRKEGDNRTPLGAYRLGTPRPSLPFGTFLPIGYPTSEQRANCFTGGDDGIHCPNRSARWLGRLGTVLDWTRGCIAVGTDAQIREVAVWVIRTRVTRVRIEGRLVD